MLLTQEYGNIYIYIEQIMNSESTSQQTEENIESINDFELRIGMQNVSKDFLNHRNMGNLRTFCAKLHDL